MAFKGFLVVFNGSRRLSCWGRECIFGVFFFLGGGGLGCSVLFCMFWVCFVLFCFREWLRLFAFVFPWLLMQPISML